MSMFAYLDPERRHIIYAKDCDESNRGRYFCFNPFCNGLMCLVLPSDSSNHFRILDADKHLDCSKLSERFCPTEYSEAEFNKDIAIDNLINGIVCENKSNENSTNQHHNDDGRIKPISTIPQIYSMCCNADYYSTYNGIEVWRILHDDSCNHILVRGIWDKHLILCRFFRYDGKTQSIYFKYPINPTLPNQYILKTSFECKELFKKIKSDVFQKSHVVIAGNWRSISARESHTAVLSEHQIWVAK